MSTDVSVITSDSSAPPSVPPSLPNDVAVCHIMIAELLDALRKEQHERDGLQHRIDQLLRRLYGPKAERFDPNQPWLIPEMATDSNAEPPADAAAEAPATDGDDDTAAKAKPKGHGRKKLPADLPRHRFEHVLTEAQRVCPDCGAVCQKFGEEISEQ